MELTVLKVTKVILVLKAQTVYKDLKVPKVIKVKSVQLV